MVVNGACLLVIGDLVVNGGCLVVNKGHLVVNTAVGGKWRITTPSRVIIMVVNGRGLVINTDAWL